MDLINYGTSIVTEEDRLSNLPIDIIQHILSFLDMKYAIQTSNLSRKWVRIWTSMPCLNFNSDTFSSLRKFEKFVLGALYYRNHLSAVSEVKLRFRGPTTQLCVTDIVNYAHLRNVRQLTITWSSRSHHELPRCLFVSHTLKHLTLINQAFSSWNSCTPNSAWDFPALETLNLTSVRLGDGSEKKVDLFAKCVNLKDINLHKCSMKGLEVFNVCVPQLSNFTITEASVLPKVLYFVAPQLETLTASASVSIGPKVLNSCSNFLNLSTAGFIALEKVNISLSNSKFRKERHVPSLLELFRILHTVKFLILDVDIIESLSSCLDQVSREPCPFDNLKCLKINTTQLKQRDCIPTIPTQVRNYLLENSPNATFIMDIPQLPLKRSRQLVCIDTVTNKFAKLEVEKKLPGSMAEEKRMLEANIQRQDQVIEQQNAKIPAQFQVNSQQMAKIRVQDQFIAQQKAKIQMLDHFIAQQKAKTQDQIISNDKAMFSAKILKQDQLFAKQRAMFEAKIAKLKDMLRVQKLQNEKLVSEIINFKLAELKIQVETRNPDYEHIGSMGFDIKSATDMIPESLRVNAEKDFSSQYEELKRLHLTCIDASQWSRVESRLGNIMHSEGFCSNHSQSHVHAAELLPANMTTSSRVVWTGSSKVVQPSQSAHM